MHKSLFVSLTTIIILILSACGSEEPPQISQSTPIPAGVVVTNIGEENVVTSEIIQRRIFDQCDSASTFKAQVKFSQSSSEGSQEELVLKAVVGGEVSSTGDFGPGVKVKIEGAIEQHFASSRTSSQGHEEGVEIEVPPNTLQEYTIVWQETRREGALEYVENGETKTASYSYRTGLELTTATGKDLSCTDKVPTLEPSNTPKPINTPKSPTDTPTPKPTNVPNPTNTPIPIPTPTIDADPTVYDNFNNPSNDGSFNQYQWESWGDAPSSQVIQQLGILIVEKEGKANSAAGVSARKYNGATLQTLTSNVPTFLEAKFMVDSETHQGNVYFNLGANLSKDSWHSQCFISDSGWFGCYQRNWGKDEHEYMLDGKQVGYGSWHTIRMELDPTDMRFAYYLDGQLLDSHVSDEKEELKKATYWLSMGTWSDNDGKSKVYFDDVRIGQIGQ